MLLLSLMISGHWPVGEGGGSKGAAWTVGTVLAGSLTRMKHQQETKLGCSLERRKLAVQDEASQDHTGPLTGSKSPP